MADTDVSEEFFQVTVKVSVVSVVPILLWVAFLLELVIVNLLPPEAEDVTESVTVVAELELVDPES